MAASSDFHIGNGGSTIHITFMDGTIPLPIDGNTALKFIFLRKDNSVKVVDAEFDPTGTGDGTDGKARYIFKIEDLDLDGKWTVQGFVRFTPLTQIYTDTFTFTVGTNLAVIP